MPVVYRFWLDGDGLVMKWAWAQRCFHSYSLSLLTVWFSFPFEIQQQVSLVLPSLERPRRLAQAHTSSACCLEAVEELVDEGRCVEREAIHHLLQQRLQTSIAAGEILVPHMYMQH